MRKSILLILVCLLANAQVLAQRPTFTGMTGPGPLSRKLMLGVKGGANFAFLTQAASFDESLQRQPGYQAGLYLRYNPIKPFSAQIEVLYNAQGWETIVAGPQTQVQSGAGQTYEVTQRMELNTLNAYLTIPMSAYVNVSPQFAIGLGLEPGTLLSSVAKGQLIYEEVNGGDFQAAKDIAVDYLNDQIGDPEGAYAFFTNDQGNPVPRNGDFYASYLLNTNLMTRFQLGRSLNAEFRLNYRLADLVNDYYDTNGNLRALNRMVLFQTILAWEFPVTRSRPNGF
jgi:hypothetical protein